MFSAVYASPNHGNRDSLWEELVNKATGINSTWLFAGDMNDTTSASESQTSSNVVRTSQNRKFRDRIDSCSLMDMGASGPKFTWSNGREGTALVQERLDRALYSANWRSLFPDGTVQNLPRTYSDHSPLLIHVYGNTPHMGINRPFRLEAAWLLDESFAAVVNNNRRGSNFSDKIKTFSNAAMNWNKNVFGNIFRKKRWILGRIEGVQRAQANQFSHNLQCLEKDVVTDFNNILAQEEMLWFQKSWAKWIVQGERNTRFFHLSTIIRRSKSKVTFLKNDNNEWVDNDDDISNLVQIYYVDLFRDRGTSIPINQMVPFQSQLTNVDNDNLCLPVSNAEIWNSIKNIQPYKAPGPDGRNFGTLWGRMFLTL